MTVQALATIYFGKNCERELELAKIVLFPHQEKALREMKNGCVLCGGVGSGKSRTSLAYYWVNECLGTLNPLKREFKNKPLFIITTARKRDTGEWQDEADHFHLKPTIDSWNNIGKYTNQEHGFFIFDEQRVVGSGAWVKSFLKISRSNHWILLTATPGDTWMEYVPVFIANGFYRNRTDFARQHVVWSRFAKYPKVDRYFNEGMLIKHRKDILVSMPFEKHTEQHHETLFLPYDEVKSKEAIRLRWNPYLNEPMQDAADLCRVLRRITNEDPSRFDAVCDILKRKKRAIIFYNFDYELDILRKLPTLVKEWNGHNHDTLPVGDSWAYLVQYNAGAEGWNCITTDTTIFYSQSYSYKQMTQAAGRIDRLNTPYTDLYYYHLSSRSKIDLAISRALKAKKNFNENDFFRF